MSDVVSMDQLISEIRAISERQSRGVSVIHDLELALDEASREYDWAKANAMLQATGTVAEKEAQVELGTKAQRLAYELAKTSLNYAKSQAKNLETTLMATQSQLSAVKATYMVGGNS